LRICSIATKSCPACKDSAGQYTPLGIAIGLGVRTQSVQSNFAQGAFKTSSNELDMAIEGRGFFQVMDPNGTIYYTRSGNFTKNANGNIVLGVAETGRPIEPPITLPQDTMAVVVSPEGMVSVRQPGQPATHASRPNSVGQLRQSRGVAEKSVKTCIRKTTPLGRQP